MLPGFASHSPVVGVRNTQRGAVCPRRAHVVRACADSPPPPLSIGDAAALWAENILVLYGGKKARDGAPIAKGEVADIMGDEPFFTSLHRYFKASGPVYKLSFGPKVFVVIQDPAMVRHVLKEESFRFDKGILAEILEDIMGSGLIPADFETWKVRRRAIAPGFHKRWLSHMTGMFGECTEVLCDKLDKVAAAPQTDDGVEMETEFCCLALDIIGKAVFNYKFDSVHNESPIIKAVYRVLSEAEHRSTNALPYWKLPLAWRLVPRQVQFREDMALISGTLNELISGARASATDTDLEELEKRDYSRVEDPSLLRFLVDLRGEETTNKQLRDDLMTLLIAGHETTAALLTWATFELAQAPHIVQRMRDELDAVLGERTQVTYDDVKKLGLVRRVLAETLRLYPEPPLLIRRCLKDTVLPKGEFDREVPLMRGTDVFINVYSLHRAPSLWENPDSFDPDRWLRPHSNPGVDGWAGYNPAEGLEEGSPLYPNESAADFAFLPFGGGTRKCVGDQFAMLESVVALAVLWRRFDFSLVGSPDDVGLATGATIHTKNGMNMRVSRCKQAGVSTVETVAGSSTSTVPSSL